MHELEFIFCKSDKIFARLINWRTYGDWSHVTVRIIDTEDHNFPSILEASFFGGVRMTTLNKLKAHNSRIISKKVKINKTASELFLVGISQLGKPYDYKAIFGAFFRRSEWVKKGAWYCSELASWMAYKMGLKFFDRSEKIITPQMLYTAITPEICTKKKVIK